jgi:hypothetical protein
MIVLKATQDKVLAALQSVAGIVERRHTLPVLANVLTRNLTAGPRFAADPAAQNSRVHDARVIPTCSSALASKPRRVAGFFSVMKVNLRNAP